MRGSAASAVSMSIPVRFTVPPPVIRPPCVPFGSGKKDPAPPCQHDERQQRLDEVLCALAMPTYEPAHLVAVDEPIERALVDEHALGLATQIVGEPGAAAHREADL